ncbi:MAG: hypothetical protein WCI20_02405 [bacterium]
MQISLSRVFDRVRNAGWISLPMFLLSDILAFSSPDIPPEASIRFVSWPGQPSCLVVRGVEVGGGVWELGESSRQVVTGLVHDAVLGPGAKLRVLEGPGTVMPDGSIWQAGATEYTQADGRVRPVPGGGSPDLIPLAADPFGNWWTVRGKGEGGAAVVAVLPYGNRTNWVAGVGCPVRPEATQVLVVADDVGGVWVSDRVALWRCDPRQVEAGWNRVDKYLPRAGISALGVAADGAALIGFSSGEVGVCDSDTGGKTVYRRVMRGEGDIVRAVYADDDGNTWMVRGTALERVPRSVGAWQRGWRAAGRLPCGNHDLTAAVVDGVCYVAGGLALSCGYPAKPRILDTVLAYDAARCLWVERARLASGRAGAGLAAFNGNVWIVNGHAATARGTMATRAVDIFDPVKGTLTPGPATRHARSMAVAAVLAGRLYVITCGVHGREVRAEMESLGPGETVWRDEGVAPCDVEAAVGCEYRGRLYLQVESAGLMSYDPATRVWRTDHAVSPDNRYRSAQVAVYKNRLWFVGGRGTPTETGSFSYDGVTDVWRAEAPAPRPCAWGAASSVGGRLLITGGAIGRCCSDQTYTMRSEVQ